MYCGAFGSIIAKVCLSVPHDAAHARDDDDAGGQVAMKLGSGLEEREKSDGSEVDSADVGVEDGGPFGEGFVVPESLFQGGSVFGARVSFGAGDTGVGDYGRALVVTQKTIGCGEGNRGD